MESEAVNHGRDHGYNGYKNDNLSRTISDFHKKIFKSKKVSIRLSMERESCQFHFKFFNSF